MAPAGPAQVLHQAPRDTQQGPDRRPWLSACQGRRQPFWVRNTHSCHKFSNTSSNSIKTYFPGDSDGTESTCNARDLHLSLGREDPLTREWLPTPVFLPGECHGQRSLAGYSPRGLKESDTTEQLTHT